MGEFSYEPIRLGSGKIDRYKHEPLRYRALKLYNTDLNIAKAHQMELERIRNTSAADFTGTVESAGNMSNWAGMDEASTMHMAQRNFHNERANAFLDLAKAHGDHESLLKKDEAKGDGGPKDIKDPFPTNSLAHIMNAEPDVHASMDTAAGFHQDLQRSALKEMIQHNNMMGEAYNANNMQAVNACSEEANTMKAISKLHEDYACQMCDYIKRKAGLNPNEDDPAPIGTNNDPGMYIQPISLM